MLNVACFNSKLLELKEISIKTTMWFNSQPIKSGGLHKMTKIPCL